MKKIILGRTGIEVTELCFGALPMGPMQKNVSIDEGADIIAHALINGINFIDTAKGYLTYPHIREAIKRSGIEPVIASKSPAVTYSDMETDIKNALTEMKLDYIDIFLLHAARVSKDVFSVRSGALDCLMDYREKGLIKAIGISTHDVGVVEAAALRDELDIVFPLINKTGMGILGGSREEMENAINCCFENGKGVYIMKALAGGNLISDYDSAMSYVRGLSAERAPIAIGMINKSEVDFNVKYFSTEDNTELIKDIKSFKKRFFVPPAVCKGCGACIAACHSGAINIVDKVAIIDGEKCLTCGYCVTECPQFAIRMI